ncbi:hypothetical protein WJX81_008099 [Elliptochloris bilobata]|uniref:Nucleoside diphosphate kinase-like domain-containing protein n=1 Tax=Elliptochloris bilobata TaxID=381761 RepID=A0AAW1S8J9_9CHLO
MGALLRTLAIVKPDAVRAGRTLDIRQRAELEGFTVLAQQHIQLTRERAEAFYADHVGKLWYPDLVAYMTSSPIVALVLARVDAIRAWRQLCGPTNPVTARRENPHCLRAMFGTDGTRNAVHGSDCASAAARELRFFFPQMVPPPPPDADAASLAAVLLSGSDERAAAARSAAVQAYMGEQLEPSLARALAELARAKPAAAPDDAAAWLARWLLDYGPTQVVAPGAPLAAHGADTAAAAAPARPSIGARAFPPGPCRAAPRGSMLASTPLGGDLGGHYWGHRPTATPQLMLAAKQWPPMMM